MHYEKLLESNFYVPLKDNCTKPEHRDLSFMPFWCCQCILASGRLAHQTNQFLVHGRAILLLIQILTGLLGSLFTVRLRLTVTC